MYYSVCVPAVYMGKKIPDVLFEIRDCGIPAFEMWGWWDQDLDAIAEAQAKTGLRMASMCTKFVSLTDPSQRQLYIESLKESIQAAKKLHCETLISQVGADTGAPREQQHASIVEGLKCCAPLVEEAGITLVLEPLNTYVDHKGYYLYSSLEGFDIIREVGSANVRLLYDIYHQQIMEGNLMQNISENIELIGHFHVAGVPGRHEPFENQEINYPAVLRMIRDKGYDKAIGLEYFPLETPQEGFSKLLPL